MADEEKVTTEEQALADEWAAALAEAGDASQDDIDALMAQGGATPVAEPSTPRAPMEEFGASPKAPTISGLEGPNLDVILDIPVTISMEVGHTDISIRNLLIQSTRANLVSVKAKYGAGLLGVLGQTTNILPNSVSITPGTGGGATDSSGLLVGYGVNLGTLTAAQLSAMNLPQNIKSLITPGVGLHLGAVNFSAVFNQIRDGMRYVTGMALTLAYHAL
ncbi:DUF3218 family protein [Pseudomonas aeruginosa]